MNTDRIKLLEQYLKEDPSDPFSIYALALEYQHQNVEKATALFEILLNEHPTYLPTYYIAGGFYVDQSKPERALEILKRGLVLAKAQQNLNSARELLSAIQNLED
jgi:tetratricopeptide (TPR) repeat protein